MNLNPSTRELRAKFWATPSAELRTMIEQNGGYQKGVFIKLGTLPERPLHGQLVDFAIACARYDARKEAEARTKPHSTRRQRIAIA